MTEFTCLGARVITDGKSESEVKASISKTRATFAASKNIWKTNNTTKIRIFKSNALRVLLYATESWKITKGLCL